MLNSSVAPESIVFCYSHQTVTEVLHPHIPYQQNDYTTCNRVHIRGYGRTISSHKHNVRSPLKQSRRIQTLWVSGKVEIHEQITTKKKEPTTTDRMAPIRHKRFIEQREPGNSTSSRDQNPMRSQHLTLTALKHVVEWFLFILGQDTSF